MVEFGRREFGVEVGFLGVPGWRGDLRWVAERAGEGIRVQRSKLSGSGIGRMRRYNEESWDGEVKVRCVLLTRGGEQA